MRRYEVMLILPPDADDRVIGGVTDRIAQVLKERGGEVVRADRWGKRRLAYEIKHLNEGVYLVVQFDARPDAVKEVDRVLTLADEVVRHKILVLPPSEQKEPERAAGAA